MNEVIADWIATGVEVLLTALFIIGMVSILSVSQVLNANVSEAQAMVVDLKEYREHNQFDFKHAYPQDIVSAIFKNRGNPNVSVRSSKGNFTWTEGTAPCEYTTTAISNLIDQTVVYDASLKYGPNGEVEGYEFTPHVNGCGRS